MQACASKLSPQPTVGWKACESFRQPMKPAEKRRKSCLAQRVGRTRRLPALPPPFDLNPRSHPHAVNRSEELYTLAIWICCHSGPAQCRKKHAAQRVDRRKGGHCLGQASEDRKSVV